VAAVRDALSIGLVTGMVLVLAIGTWCCVPGRRRAQEKALRERLAALRKTIAIYRGDYGRFPDSLGELVRRGYLRRLPADPVTGSRVSWIEIRSAGCTRSRTVDVKSGAAGRALDGSDYRTW
jgi:general secretion pathway protein G